MSNFWASLVYFSHFVLLFQNSFAAKRSLVIPGIRTVLAPPDAQIGQSTGNAWNNVLLASLESHGSPSTQEEFNSPKILGSSAFGVPENPTVGINKGGSAKVKVSSLKVTNITSGTLGMLNFPFGERATYALTFPANDESVSKTKNSNSYGDYAPYGHFNDQQSTNEVKFTTDGAINVGGIVSDAFVLKERMDIQPGSSIGSNPSDPSAINRFINNVLEQNTARILNGRNEPDIHSPGDLIAREIPLDGVIDYTGLNNLTEFLIRETAKPRTIHLLNPKQAALTPMFVSMQFNTLGRQKINSFDEEVEKKGRIHVVLGNEHFEIENIGDLSPLNGQSQITVALINEFVNYSFKQHRNIYKNAQRRSKDITDRLAALTQDNPGNTTTRFQPNRPLNREQPLEFVAWPYVVTLAFRTLFV